jgi:hydroxyacylglutathione hydrolase
VAHSVTELSAPFSIARGALQVHMVPAWQDNLIWLLVDPITQEAVAVDGPEATPVLAYCESLGLSLVGIINTHTHGDHIGINRALESEGLLHGMRVIGCRTRADEIPGITESVDEGDTIAVGSTDALVLRTEGHIDGHLSYIFDGAVFCGDTLFGGGCGYLFDGPPAKMLDSLLRLAQLPGATKVCCAHEYTQDNLRFAWMIEPDNAALRERIQRVWALRAEGRCSVPDTIAVERATNPFLRGSSPSLLAQLRELCPSAQLNSPVDVFAATRALKDSKRHREIPDGALPL